MTVFLWTVCVSEVPDGFWTRRRPEALAEDAVLYCTTALVSVGNLPHYGLSCDFFVVKEGRLDLEFFASLFRSDNGLGDILHHLNVLKDLTIFITYIAHYIDCPYN